jgi:hypothetical protein
MSSDCTATLGIATNSSSTSVRCDPIVIEDLPTCRSLSRCTARPCGGRLHRRDRCPCNDRQNQFVELPLPVGSARGNSGPISTNCSPSPTRVDPLLIRFGGALGLCKRGYGRDTSRPMLIIHLLTTCATQWSQRNHTVWSGCPNTSRTDRRTVFLRILINWRPSSGHRTLRIQRAGWPSTISAAQPWRGD